jgi:predicted Zn-dependent protease
MVPLTLSRRGRRVLPVLLPAAVAWLVSACATNPVTGKRQFTLMSEAQEIQIGHESDAEVRKEMGVYDDPELQRYVEQVGTRLAASSERPNLPWHFTIVDVAAVNAFALPGGYISITRGILPYLDDEAELAGVLGHEIGHVTARHAAEQYTRAMGAQLGLAGLGIFVPEARPFGQAAESGLGLLFLKYSRDDELQADQLGAGYAARNGWDPKAVPEFLATLGRLDATTDRAGVPNWLLTHPQPTDRVERIQTTVQTLEQTAGSREWTTDRDAYLRRIDGLVFGDDPREGVVRGREFLHPGLRFALRFPPGWDISNGKTQVVAKQPGADVYMLLQAGQASPGESVRSLAVNGMARAGFRQLDGAPASISGLSAYVGTYEGAIQGIGDAVVRAAHISDGRTVYLVAGLAAAGTYPQVEGLFTASIRSFRSLTSAEAEAIRPNRVDLYVARAGDTWQSIAERSGNTVQPATLAIMNNHAVDDPPRPGKRLKIVVAG